MSRTIHLRSKPAGPAEEARRPAPAAGEPPTGASHFPFLHPPADATEIGRLGNYRVVRLLGQGGMGFVFQAEDIALRRAVALKVMKPDLAPDDSGCDRFLREARLMASVRHEHVVTVFQVGQEGHAPYIAMELLHGKTLEQWMKQARKIGVPAVLRLGRQVAAGLAGIHGHCLIHRDIKPANIWLEAPKARVKILDFGLARVAGDCPHLTQSGLIVGTPSYMSPEQARGETLDARSDLFSLGCVLYEMCSGVRPFQAPTTMALLTALAVKDPCPIHEMRPSVPKELSDLVMRLLAKEPADRIASAEEVAVRLQQIESRLKGRPTPTPQPIPAPPRAPSSATHRELPVKPRTPTRVKKARAAARRRQQLFLGASLAAVVIVSVFFTALATFLSRGAAPRGATAAPPPPRSAPSAEPAPPESAAVYLSELMPVDDRNPIKTPPPPPPRAPGQPPPPFFAGVAVHGLLLPHGLFMHPAPQPNGGEASLRYRLGGQYATFTAETSLNDGPAESDTPLAFSVFGDDRLIWQSSRPLKTQADGERCVVSVKGVDYLTIRVSCPGFPRGAHAVWIDPQVAP